ncbi:MAG: 16S rRNA (cytosine(967)-C(5))-methyltransferase RsmB [Oxalobacteraceae bacterium]|nr:16S rRNA (cytosine(967)-C(5))-methyltransferase RsmB [Oxalobacteraceae bacterium]
MTTSTLKIDSLSYSLLRAAQAVALVRGGTALPLALAKVIAQSNTPVAARGAIQDIAYRAMRQLGRSEVLLSLLAKKQPDPAILHSLLCCALALIAPPDDAAGALPYEVFTVVDQAVTAASAHGDMAHAKGMVNAVLRRFLRERDALLQQALQQPSAVWNYPDWWIAATQSAYPKQWQAILQAGNTAPPLTLRINCRQTTMAAYLTLLASNGMAATQIGPFAVRLEKPLPVSQIPGFMAGLVSVQDASAQLAAPLLDVQDGMRVLDACAAPGGKTGHLLELADIELVALDNDARRLPRIEENLQRLRLPPSPPTALPSTAEGSAASRYATCTLKTGDAQARYWWDGQLFDRILADVPCTASGIVRRHPDIRWLRRKSDAAQLATLSGQILDNLWRMLRPGGKLLFVTCSVWPQESQAQADAFALRNQARRLPAPGQLLPATGLLDDHDGLFYALFQKAFD